MARLTSGIHENTQLVYHGIGGLISVVRWKTQANDALCLCRLNDLKKLVGKEGTIDIHKQLLLAISIRKPLGILLYLSHLSNPHKRTKTIKEWINPLEFLTRSSINTSLDFQSH